MNGNGNHRWKFFRAGGFEQVRLDTGADLLALDQLDQKLWVALACPTSGLEFDAHTLALIDTNGDGRIRAPEILEAVRWTCRHLKDPNTLLAGAAELPLSAINDATPEGRQLLASARQILTNLGKADSQAIAPADTVDTKRIFGKTKFNGDGLITADSAPDDPTRKLIGDVIACLGSEPDRNGNPGINQARVNQFFAEAKAYSDWHAQAQTNPAVLPLGGATADAAAVLQKLRPKAEDYFARCRLAAYDPRSVPALNREEKEYVTMGGRDLSAAAPEVAAFPLAMVGPGKPLPLKEGLNPAWSGTVAALVGLISKPLLNGRTALSEADWGEITSRFAAYDAWMAAKPATSVEKLGLSRLNEILSGPGAKTLGDLIAEDKKLEAEANGIASVDKLVHFHRDLYKLLNNFVSFRDFYGRRDKAIFQTGTLFLDQRSCELCLPVEDAAKHASMAGLAGAYLAYCDCVRKATGEKRQIVAAFTGGDSDNLMVGRNGIFYDRKGNDWDATITKIIDNPISIRQAFWSPYKKFVRMIEEQVAKRAAAAEASTTDKLSTAAVQVAKADQIASQTAKKPLEPRKFDVGVVAALGVGVGAISGAMASIVSGLVKMAPWQIPLVFISLMLLISLPSMVIAWLKLRKRNLGPILDANGWAVNARARVNVPFGGSLTKVAKLPPGAETDWVDPFADKKSPWPMLIGVAVVLWIVYALLSHMGYVYEWTNGRLGKPREATPAKTVLVPGTVVTEPSAKTPVAAPAPAAEAAK